MKEKIIINNLTKAFNNTTVLRDINLKVLEGSSIAVVGGSGSGKSVLIKCIAGLLTATTGSIIVNGCEVSKVFVEERPKEVRERMGMLFQSNALFDSMTVSENIAFGVYNRIAKNGYITTKQRLELEKLALAQLEIVQLARNNLDKYPYELSGGMQKRVAIARLISPRPEIILLDEPTTGLDPVTAGTIARLMIEIKNRIDATMITITHDPICLSEIAQSIVLIEDKTIAWNGTLQELHKIDKPYLNAFKKVIN
jgi:phospholipid/cholesterol/gamma-HCH transport system ATP-binding protein